MDRREALKAIAAAHALAGLPVDLAMAESGNPDKSKPVDMWYSEGYSLVEGGYLGVAVAMHEEWECPLACTRRYAKEPVGLNSGALCHESLREHLVKEGYRTQFRGTT